MARNLTRPPSTSAEALERLSRVTAGDVAEARLDWRLVAPRQFKNLLNAREWLNG